MADKTVTCECGFNVTGDEDTLVAATQKHGREVHNMDVSKEQVLAMAKPSS
jgi:predicted small metal-binding protein